MKARTGLLFLPGSDQNYWKIVYGTSELTSFAFDMMQLTKNKPNYVTRFVLFIVNYGLKGKCINSRRTSMYVYITLKSSQD